MAKFENKVALMKTSHFIKTTPLIVFIELLSTAKQRKSQSLSLDTKKYKKQSKSSVLKEIRSLLKLLSLRSATLPTSTHTNEISLPFALGKKEENQKNFVFKQMKNNYVKKILTEQSALVTPFFPNNLAASLSQANNLVIFLNDSSLFVLEKLEQNENISILGGIYKKRVLNHNQISRLIELSKDNTIYHKLNFVVKEKSFFGRTLLTETPLRFFSFFYRDLYAKLYFTIFSRMKNLNNQFKQ